MGQVDVAALVAATQCRTIAEIGIGTGRTSLGVAQTLDGDGVLYLFDFQEKVDTVAAQLRERGYSNVIACGCSSRRLDSYNWPLAKLLREHDRPLFDFVYLDGAHTWVHDALAFLLIDRLLQPGGYVVFDDYDWTIAASPTVNPNRTPIVRELYTDEQMHTPQVKWVVDLLVKRDPSYLEISENQIYRKRPSPLPI
ncbi:MAG: class I SAM-dependent methyltransferase [Acidobacteria bacterium]|nr:class I SAM-dependent methyltransferase [Acidobacteriota bacterium]